MPSVYQTVFGGNPIAPAVPTYLSLAFAVNTILGWPLESNITSPAVAEWIDCNATAAALTLQLSDARAVSTGYTAIFNNIGANTFTVLDAQGNALLAPASGAAWILVLADNSTLQGTWRALQLGAGVSVANAASLAGNGLKAITTTLNERILINPQAASYPIVVADRASCVEWTGGSGGVFTAPAPATVGSDWFCYIKNSGTGVLTLTPATGTIDGSANKTFNPNDSCVLVSDGATLFTMGFGQSVASSFNFVTISLAGAGPGTVVLAGAQLNRISYKFTGALAGNVIVQVPASIQQYWVDNETTGAFTLTISSGAGGTFTVPQATRVILYCDGLNIVNAVSSGAGSVTLVADGTAAAPGLAWASDTQMGLYKVGTDILGISTAGALRVSINATGTVTVNAPSSSASTLILNEASGSTSGALAIVGAAGDAVRMSLQDGNTGTRQYVVRVGGAAVGTFDIFDFAAGVSRLQINSTGNLSGWGPVAVANVDMTPDTSTFNGAFTGGTGFPASTCRWVRSGNMVTLSIGSGTGASNAGTFTMTGLPAAIQPLRNMFLPVVTATDGGSLVSDVTARLDAGSGTITFMRNGGPANWTNSGTKGFTGAYGPVLTYPIN